MRTIATLLLTMIWVTLALLPGCGRGNGKTSSTFSQPDSGGSTEANPIPAAAPLVTPSPSLIPGTGRVINFRGLDNNYHGTTAILPNQQIIHRKEAP